jgi:beta-lactamase class A
VISRRAFVLTAAALITLTSCASRAMLPLSHTSGGTLHTSSATSHPAASDAKPTHAADAAAQQIRDLTKELGAGGVSVAALRTDDGSLFRYGARGGMATGSIAKLYILEALLLQHDDDDAPLSDSERDAATRMIENSDNGAADQLFADVGTVDGLNNVAGRLGVKNTQPGENYLWGFTETCADDYLALLRDLIGPSALSRSARLFALELMANVESDQRWGVSAAADPGTTVRLKNGWLPSDPDDGRWLVNSVGVVTVHGHQVLLAVLTQHGDSFEEGVELVERIAKVAASVVA